MYKWLCWRLDLCWHYIPYRSFCLKRFAPERWQQVSVSRVQGDHFKEVHHKWKVIKKPDSYRVTELLPRRRWDQVGPCQSSPVRARTTRSSAAVSETGEGQEVSWGPTEPCPRWDWTTHSSESQGENPGGSLVPREPRRMAPPAPPVKSKHGSCDTAKLLWRARCAFFFFSSSCQGVLVSNCQELGVCGLDGGNL